MTRQSLAFERTQLPLDSEFKTSKGWAAGVVERVRASNLYQRGTDPRWCVFPALASDIPWLDFQDPAETWLGSSAIEPCMSPHGLLNCRTFVSSFAPDFGQLSFDFSTYSILAPSISIITPLKSYVNYTRFVPSILLTSFVQRGLKVHIAASKSRKLIEENLKETSTNEAQAEFAVKLKRLIATIGNRLRYGLLDSDLISENGRFSIDIQYAVLDRFVVIPDETTQFLTTLCSELSAYIAGGGKFAGRWGEMILLEGDLRLATNKTEQMSAGWTEAERISD